MPVPVRFRGSESGSRRIRARCSWPGSRRWRSATWGAHRLPEAAVGGVSGIAGSPSKAAGDALRNEFDNPFLDPLVVAVSAPQLRVDERSVRRLGAADRERDSAGLPEVRRVRSCADARDPQLRSTDGHQTHADRRACSHEIAARERAV